jgi:hypothetical protein
LWKVGLGGLLLASSPLAFAQEAPVEPYDPAAPVDPQRDDRKRMFGVRTGPATEHLRTPMGVAFSVGGGVTNFVRDTARDQTGVGGYWEVRGTFGTRSPVGLDVAYIGQARDVDAPGLDPDSALVGNGLEGALRLQIPAVVGTRFLLEPYAFGGIGWIRYDVVSDDFNTSPIVDSDDVMTFPVGAGIGFGGRGFLADARFSYRFVTEDRLLTADGSTFADMANWAVGLTLGYEF